MLKKLLIMALFSGNIFATPVNVNKADAKTIAESLKGIPLKKAEAFVANRVKKGNVYNINDLKRIMEIDEKTILINQSDILFFDRSTSTRHARNRNRHGRDSLNNQP
jgi:competence protein ComEA